ncbi:uncharacterized protein LOC125232760 [Leguminivora glycinivorella]|uniref:uncharacterized protein LOC125232760 n=1 Tax=Leguminivora glycinivorella TaxID=1035111 RepID=UPI00200C9AF4|nr:uncharacterized protein LOC125232760 [Leguminivora glycinivorella]
MSSDIIQTRNTVPRKRGRPAGRGRVSLTLYEKRALNASYEKERRAAMNEALENLAKEDGVQSTLSVPDLLAEVSTLLQKSMKRDKYWDAERLRKANEDLESEIEMLEYCFPTETEPKRTCPMKRKVADCGWPSPPSKRVSTSPSQEPVPVSTCQRVLPRLVRRASAPDTGSQQSQLQTRQEESYAFPLACVEEHLSPHFPEGVGCSSLDSAPSPVYCSIKNVQAQITSTVDNGWGRSLQR